MRSSPRMITMAPALAIIASLAACAPGRAAGPAPMPMASANPMVGGKAMLPGRNIVQNALNSPDHTTLVAAVKQAGLVGALEGKGPFTVFAPVNSAFAALPAGTVASLMQPANKAKLTAVLTYHVVPGHYDQAALEKLVMAGGGKAMLKTLDGASLTFMMNGPHNVVVVDDHGNIADITTYDVEQSNGVIQVIDKVLLP